MIVESYHPRDESTCHMMDALQDKFPSFFQRVVELNAEEFLQMHERVSYLVFLINTFQVSSSGCGCCRCDAMRIKHLSTLTLHIMQSTPHAVSRE